MLKSWLTAFLISTQLQPLDVYGNQISHLKLGFQTIKAIHQAVRREKLTFELMTYQQGLINLERIINKITITVRIYHKKYLN